MEGCVYSGVLSFYYQLFYHMEDEQVLDPLNELHIAALHFTFLPKINAKLQIWQNAWSLHRMRTAKSSPQTLWMSGQLQTPVGINEISTESELELYGVEGNTDAQNAVDDNERPIVDSASKHLSERCLQRLHMGISTHTTTNFGQDTFLKAVEIIELESHLN
ncbi:hypothetical protein KP79_PYT14540 [Mizuhopecten yessoensis]|uniref:Integrase core domain-containing protein n=1 Tax=Mizuhopecten yessoensis TaxID=6573 RepID=A0A210R294_MIZYE|nr:hypothetical protein KP79_PYT14540 [Mizuhopecten yessoensis]